MTFFIKLGHLEFGEMNREFGKLLMIIGRIKSTYDSVLRK
jgi:hypothetical protein